MTGGLFLKNDIAGISDGREFIPDHDQFLVASSGWTWSQVSSGTTVSFTFRHETGAPIELDEDDASDLRSQPGSEMVDFDRGRVAPRTIMAVQMEIPIWRHNRRSATLRASVMNLFDARYAYNFGNPFSGTHFGASRTAAVGLRIGL